MNPLLRILLFFAMLSPVAAFADSWVRPEPRVAASPDTRMLARITPGRAGEPARASLYRLDAGQQRYDLLAGWDLPQRRAPVAALLNDSGQLVVVDEWGEMGKGQVLTVFGGDGEPRFAFTLKQLLGERASGALATVSSVWWRCGEPMLTGDGSALRVVTYDEGELIVGLDDGRVAYQPGNGRCR